MEEQERRRTDIRQYDMQTLGERVDEVIDVRVRVSGERCGSESEGRKYGELHGIV